MDPVALSAAETAKQRARLDLLNIVVLQQVVNTGLMDALLKLSRGEPPPIETLEEMHAANAALSKKMEAWLSEMEQKVPRPNE